MNENKTNNSYEKLYGELFDRAEALHESNKRRLRRGLIGLIVLPVVLIIIRLVTDSDKIVFLIVWVVCMFLLCAYLMTVEYLDDSIQKTLINVTNQEAEFDELLLSPEDIQERLRERLAAIKPAKEEADEAPEEPAEEGGAE